MLAPKQRSVGNLDDNSCDMHPLNGANNHNVQLLGLGLLSESGSLASILPLLRTETITHEARGEIPVRRTGCEPEEAQSAKRGEEETCWGSLLGAAS